MPLFVPVLPGLQLGKCLPIFLNCGKNGQFPCQQINTPTATATNPKPPEIKSEPQDPDQSNASATVAKPEHCGWGPNCPICKNAEEHPGTVSIKSNSTNWQKHANKYTAEILIPKPRYQACPDTKLQHNKGNQVPQNQSTWTQSFKVLDQYAEQICLRREWEEKMEWKQKVQTQLFLSLKVRLRVWWRENYQYKHK